MVNDASGSASFRFMLLIGGLTVLAISATLGLSYVIFSPPHGFVFWISTFFACLIEFIVGTLWIYSFASSRNDIHPSGATRAIIFGVIGLYALSGLVSIVVYSAFRGPEGNSDDNFTAFLAGISVFWFIIVAILYGHDTYSRNTTKPAIEKRDAHIQQARSLQPALSIFRGVVIADDVERQRLASIAKKLEVIETALSHSHGGGVHSSGILNPASDEDEMRLADYINRVREVSERLTNDNSEDRGVIITELEGYTARLGSMVEALNLT